MINYDIRCLTPISDECEKKKYVVVVKKIINK